MDNVNSSGFDTGKFSEIIRELNISRNYVSAYPEGHPVISSSSERLATRFNQLLKARTELIIGITKDSLAIRGIQPVQNSPAFREFAGALFRHGIAAITFSQGLGPEDLVKFNEMLLEKREHIRDKGGFEHVIGQTGIRGIRISEVNYDSFQLVEEEILSSLPKWHVSASPWEVFVQRLLAPASQSGNAYAGDIDPQQLAAMINDLYGPSASGKLSTLAEALQTFLTELATAELSPAVQKEFFNKIGSFAGSLHPDLLKQLIRTAIKTFSTKPAHLPDDKTLPREDDLCRALSGNYLGNASLPPLVMSLVDVLAKHTHAGPDANLDSVFIDQNEAQDMAAKLMLLFREDKTDEYVPPKYLKALSTIVNSESFLENYHEDLNDLTAAMDKTSLDCALGEIIMEIMNSGLIESLDRIRDTLLDIFSYCLQTGDYQTLIKLHERALLQAGPGPAGKENPSSGLLAFFGEKDFVEEILNGLQTWGKGKYADIGTIIGRVGKPFVEPLLDRLVEEQNLSVRRYYMSLLIGLAETAKENAVKRLGDSRWYVLRNIIIILRSSNDPGVMQHMKALLDHPHPRVRQNVLETFIHFNSPDSDFLLLKEMRSSDPSARISAIQLAGKGSSPEIFAHLASLLLRGLLTSRQLPGKKAAAGALAEMGKIEAFPILDAVLSKKGFLFRSNLVQLQIEIVNSLDRYPANVALALLNKAARSGNAQLSKTALEKLRTLEEKAA
ncbi:MAG: HEAT repeat domain-containing protein [Geobacteraceae bacterium]|nr:HEAT repeat domain-containing protein [Geobacteraceae bacterium]